MKKKNSGVILMAYKSVLGLKGVYPFLFCCEATTEKTHVCKRRKKK